MYLKQIGSVRRLEDPERFGRLLFQFWDGEKWVNFDDHTLAPEMSLRLILESLRSQDKEALAVREVQDLIKAIEGELRIRGHRTREGLGRHEVPEDPPEEEGGRRELDPREKENLTPEEILRIKALALKNINQDPEQDFLTLEEALPAVNFDLAGLGKWLALGQIVSAALTSGQKEADQIADLETFIGRIWTKLGDLEGKKGGAS